MEGGRREYKGMVGNIKGWKGRRKNNRFEGGRRKYKGMNSGDGRIEERIGRWEKGI